MIDVGAPHAGVVMEPAKMAVEIGSAREAARRNVGHRHEAGAGEVDRGVDLSGKRACLLRNCSRTAQVKAGLVTGFALSFAHTLGEFGVVLMVGGNIPGVTRTISIDIYDQVQAAQYSSANWTAVLLLLISFAALSIVYGINRRPWAVGPSK
jgi:ABC-type sulfate transport system permease subunit